MAEGATPVVEGTTPEVKGTTPVVEETTHSCGEGATPPEVNHGSNHS